MADLTSTDRMALSNLLSALWERATHGDRLRITVELVAGGPTDEAPQHVSVKASLRDPESKRHQRFRSGVMEGRHISDAVAEIRGEVERLRVRL